MKMNAYTQIRPAKAAKTSRKKVVALGSPVKKEPRTVAVLRNVPVVKLPYGKFLAVAN